MRTFLSCIILALSAISLKAQDIVNPSFSIEEPRTKEVAKGWQINTDRIYYDTANAHSKPGCIHIYNNDYFESVCKQTIPFKPGKFRKYKMKLFIKTESRKGFAGAYVTALDASGKMVYKNAIPDGLINGKKRWQQYEVEYQVTADVAKLELGFYFYDKGKAWFDDISIEALPESNRPTSKVAEKYIGELYKILDKQCWYRDSVDLPKICKNALELVPDAKTTGDCYEAVAYVLERLGDKLGRFYDPSTVKGWKKEQEINNREPLYPAVKMMEDNYAYILLPGMTATKKEILEKYADTLHTQLAALDQKKIKGWVLDLRENVGGNATTMLAAIGPLLHTGTPGKYIRRKGTVPWTYKNGKATIDTTTIKVTTPYTAPSSDLPLAILTSDATYGAGELVFVALKMRPKTSSFGERTAGVTYNEKIVTLSDGAMLFFTAGVIADARGLRYDGRIRPDEPIRLIYKEDLCMLKAMKWLKLQN